MAGWFPVAAFCFFSCTAASFADDPGLESLEACNVVLERSMRSEAIFEFIEFGDVKAECLPAVRIRNRQPEYLLKWLDGEAPGERS